MIDTSKYEGHLIDKAVENYSQVWCWSKWMLKNAETIEQHKATAALLEDAPLLLAEVERLREKLFEAELWVNNESYTFENNIKELNDYAEAIE